MKSPTTLKGYLALIKRVANIQLYVLKGYDKLSQQQKIDLGSISAEMDNIRDELETQLENEKSK